MQGRCWHSHWNLRHSTKPFGSEEKGQSKEMSCFDQLIDWLIYHLFICETKAFKFDLTILLVDGEPIEQQQSESWISDNTWELATKSQVTLLGKIKRQKKTFNLWKFDVVPVEFHVAGNIKVKATGVSEHHLASVEKIMELKVTIDYHLIVLSL